MQCNPSNLIFQHCFSALNRTGHLFCYDPFRNPSRGKNSNHIELSCLSPVSSNLWLYHCVTEQLRRGSHYRSFGMIYPWFTPPDNRRRDLVWDWLVLMFVPDYLASEGFTDPSTSRTNHRLIWVAPDNFKHVWWLGYVTTFSEQDHNSQWVAEQLTVLPSNGKHSSPWG